MLFLSLFACFFAHAQKTERIRLKEYKIGNLSDTLRETSGLLHLNKKLYTFNDGGNVANIYEINPKNGKINKSLKTNLNNTDWEAITTDSTFIYLGDFGNNLGKRKDLVVYKLQFDQDSILSLHSKIPFEYENQSDFSSRNTNNDFDAEAMFYLNEKIHLFSKEWKSKTTSHYVLDPNSSEKQKLQRIENFQTKFFITDVAYFNQKLYFIGYTRKGKCFLLIFNTDNQQLFFNSPYKKYCLGSALTIGQIEGITVTSEGIYISNESITTRIFKVKPSLYFIPFSSIKE